MPGDNYKRVHSGERLQIPAAAWNDLLGMLADWKRDGFVQRAGGPELSKAPVKVRNATGAALGQFAIVKINGVTIDPDDNEEGFRRQVCLEGATPDAADNVVAILQRAAAAGEVVPAVMTGESVALVNVSSAAHGYAAPASGQTVLVSQAAAGPWRILWANGTGNGTWCVVRSESSTAAGIVARKGDGTYTANQRQKISFKEGSNVTLTVADDATAGEIDVTIAASSASYSLTVKESDGNPIGTNINSIVFDQADGYIVTSSGANEVTLTLADASSTQTGVVNITTQTFKGDKTFLADNLIIKDSDTATASPKVLLYTSDGYGDNGEIQYLDGASPFTGDSGLGAQTELTARYGSTSLAKVIALFNNSEAHCCVYSNVAGGASYFASLRTNVAGTATVIYKGIDQTVTLAKLTAGGANGSLTVTGGIVTGYTAPT